MWRGFSLDLKQEQAVANQGRKITRPPDNFYQAVEGKIVNILGQDYQFLIDVNGKTRELNAAGLCEFLSKEIVVDDFESEVGDLKNIEEYRKRTIRHEMIHAFLYESGLNANSSWARNEEMIDFFAIQLPKIVKAMKEVGCLE